MLCVDDMNDWVGCPDLKYFIKKMADKWLPKEEAPQVTSGRELYNVADSDNPVFCAISLMPTLASIDRSS